PDELQKGVVSRLSRTVGREEKVFYPRLNGHCDGGRSRGDKSVDHHRDSLCRGPQRQASQASYLKASYFREYVDRIRDIGLVRAEGPLDDVDFPMHCRFIEPGAFASDFRDWLSAQDSCNGTRRRCVADSHFACADELLPIALGTFGKSNP